MTEVPMFSLQNPLFRDVFIDTLKTLSVEGESFEVCLYALKLQTALENNPTESKVI
jgi:hypothetical protein